MSTLLSTTDSKDEKKMNDGIHSDHGASDALESVNITTAFPHNIKDLHAVIET